MRPGLFYELRKKRPGLISFFWTCSLVALFLQPALLACPVCFQVEQNSTTRGLQAAVLVLIAVTTGVLTGFGVFIVKFARRS